MSVLVDRDIIEAMVRGDIVIRPFNRDNLGTNSYDVRLASTLRVYDKPVLDLRVPCSTTDVEIPASGLVLEPGKLYLASTMEYTESRAYVPMLNGRSSLGRYGLSIHVTAGTGDRGFRGVWTMELFVVQKLRVYPGIPVGQLLWFTTTSEPLIPYDAKPSAKYNNVSKLPQASKLHEELEVEAKGCKHEVIASGKPVHRRWGTYATEVCQRCFSWRRMNHRGGDVSEWFPASTYEHETRPPEED